MYKHSEFVTTPTDDTIIWRYMDFTKFFSLVNDSALYFPSAEKLAEIDPFEGSFPKGNINYDPMADSLLEKHNENMEDVVAAAGDIKEVLRFLRSVIKDRFRKSTFINSWYMKEYESAAMWKIYADRGDGIAVRSTIGRLKSAISSHQEHDIFVGRIEYIDYENGLIPQNNLFAPFMFKRKSFEHESELRALISIVIQEDVDFDLPDGLSVTIDLKSLIEAVYIAPSMPDWIAHLVTSVLLQKGLSNGIVKSSMNDKALW